VGLPRAALIVACACACGDNRAGGDARDAAPVFRHPLSLPDDELARQSLQILGADVPGAKAVSCNGCHGLTTQRLRYWGRLADKALATCLTDFDVSTRDAARAQLDCLRAMPSSPTSDFQTRKLGGFASAAHLPWFAYVFDLAYGADAPAQLAAFRQLAGMPRGDVPALTQDELDVVAEWFVRGLPALETTLVPPPPPDQCTPMIASDVATHVAAMATQGWAALNRQSQLAMFGCGAATDPRACLQSYPFATDLPFGTGWEISGRGRIRVLADVTYTTSFWTRSSADGRFVAHGVADIPGSYVIDLQRALPIPIDALYDPAFFPDASGFVFQGGARNICPAGVLTSNPSAIAMTEPGCRAIAELGLYQHVGARAGGDYFAVDGLFVADDGGKLPTVDDPDAAFVASTKTSFTPMIFDGTGYAPRGKVDVPTPFEGDPVLSPSAQLIVTRLAGPADHQLGYVLRRVDATFDGASYAIDTPELARYCVSGGKPGFSYDERWLVFHHYEPSGAANLYLMELATGAPVQITNLRPGQYALFPHFRSDGWIYAQVRDMTTAHEYTIATDAALQ